MYRITFVVDPLRQGMPSPTGARQTGRPTLKAHDDLSRRSLLVLLNALMDVAVEYLRAYPATPSLDSLLRSGKIKYTSPRPVREPVAGRLDREWHDIPTCISRGEAGPEDLAAWRAAEDQVRGLQSFPAFEAKTLPNGTSVYAFSTRFTSGKTFDWPCPALGAPQKEYVVVGSRITFVLDLFKGKEDEAASHAALKVLLNALKDVDVLYLLAHPETPSIYRAGVRYEVEPEGQEDWADIPTCIRLGIFDCEDGAAWRCAELQVKAKTGALPTFKSKQLPNGCRLYHIQVRYPNGLIEDPSRALGME